MNHTLKGLEFPLSLRAFVLRLISGVLLVNLFVVALAVFFLYEARIQAEELAKSRSSSLSQLLENNLNECIEEINLTLLTISDEIERLITKDKIENINLENYLTRLHERIPEISRLLVSNAQGELLFESKGLVKRANIADRDYYIKLKNDPTGKLIIGEPVLSATAGNWILPFARRLNNKDGSCAAIVIASIRLEYIQKLFSSFGLGDKDLVVLRSEDLSVIVRHPEPEGIGSTVGQKEVTDVFKEFVKSGKSSTTFKVISPVDNIERSFSAHKLSRHQLYIVVGLATSEYLKDWRIEVVRVSLLVILFITGTLIFTYYFVRMQKQERLKEEELRQTKAILQAAMDQSSAGIAIADAPDGKLRYVNDAGLLIRGSDRQSVVNGVGIDQYVASWQLFDFDGRPLEPDEVPLARSIMLGETNSREFIIRRKEGNDCIVSANAAPIYDKAGNVIAGIVVFTDITDRKLSEEKLKIITQRLHLATSAAHLGVWDWNVRDNTMVWDDRMFELYGVKPDAFSSNIDAWTNGLHPDDKDMAFAECQAALNGEKKFDTIFRVLHPDGTVKHIKANALVIRGKDGAAERMIGINADVSKAKKSEEELKEANEFLTLTIKSAGSAMWAMDCITGQLYWSPEQFLMLGLEPASTANYELWKSTLHPDDIDVAEANITNAMRDHTDFFNEYRIIKPTGEIRWINAFGQTIYDESGAPQRMYGICLDITDRKKAEEEKHALEQQLQHTQKLESLGVLAGGIAHDFNNILAIIVGYCGLTKLNYGKAEKNIPIIEEAAERAAGLCRQMLAYAGKAQLTKSKINMVKEVEEILGMLKATLPQNAVIKTDLSSEIPLIEGDSSQLRQVVMNLIINASEAIGTEQGVVDISFSRIKLIAGKIYEDYNGKPIPPGEYVCLEVTDNGCGMNEETKWRIFEPFYTTKFTGRGLGMSAVLGIIKSHAGALKLFSQPGQGTTFKVYLPIPISETNRGQNQIESTQPAPWQAFGTILLAEDEDHVRDIAKNFLEMFGFTVLEAVNGKEALDLYHKNAKEITLVLTDMGMPVMDGYELFHKLKSFDPELPIIISSGYGDVEVTARIGSDNIAGIISKPYTHSQLRGVLKKVLDNK